MWRVALSIEILFGDCNVRLDDGRSRGPSGFPPNERERPIAGRSDDGTHERDRGRLQGG